MRRTDGAACDLRDLERIRHRHDVVERRPSGRDRGRLEIIDFGIAESERTGTGAVTHAGRLDAAVGSPGAAGA
jgi:hypothetical protein